jgi:hypothetical protein
MKKYLFGIVLIIVLLIGSVVYWKYFFTYSDGYRAGLLQKFSRRGSVFKTYEGEMILSSIQTSAEMAIASEKFLFSVEKEEVAKKLEKVQGENVIVHYREKNGTLVWRGDTRFIVDSVSVKEASPPLLNH